MFGVVNGHQQHVDVSDGTGHVRRPVGPVVAQVQEADAARLQAEHDVWEITEPRRP